MKKNNHSYKNYQSGATLVEVLVAIVLLSLVAIPFILSLNNLNKHFTRLTSINRGQYLSQRNLEIIANIAQYNWTNLPRQEPAEGEELGEIIVNQAFHLSKIGDEWIFMPGDETVGAYSTQITFYEVCRNSEFQIINCEDATASDQYDSNSIKAISETYWSQEGREQSIVLESVYTYLF